MRRGLFVAGKEATARALARACYRVEGVLAHGGMRTLSSGQTVTGPIVWIVDEFRESVPTPSVTNDAERVCVELNLRYPGYRIIYRDTSGHWDELMHRDGVFAGFIAARHLRP